MLPKSKKFNVSLKVLSIGILILILSLITFSIQGLIRDRINHKSKALNTVSKQWGQTQVLMGPYIKLPYEKVVEVNQTAARESAMKVRTEVYRDYLYLLPKKISTSAKLDTKSLYKGIYQQNVYHADTKLTGYFEFSDEDLYKLNGKKIIWNEASFSFNIGDIKSLKNEPVLSVNNTDLNLNNVEKVANFYQLSSRKPYLKGPNFLKSKFEFSLDLNLNGSRAFYLVPVARENIVKMDANWADPNFNGAYIPEERTISDAGFKAKWQIFNLNNDYQSLLGGAFDQLYNANIGSAYHDNSSIFGVELYSPVDIYTKSKKTLKYSLLFITLTFSLYFFIEVLFKQRLHPIQYLMIGMAVSIFYLLLLAFAEHIGFDLAYLIAALAAISLIGTYTYFIMSKPKIAASAIALITLLYGYLYLLLQLNDYSLLFGSIGLFIVLAIIMLASRKIDWYEESA
jgi:inner membrane protein